MGKVHSQPFKPQTMKVTYHEFLAMLSEDEARAFDENVNKESDREETINLVDDPIMFLTGSFIWQNTPQGHSFWMDKATRFL